MSSAEAIMDRVASLLEDRVSGARRRLSSPLLPAAAWVSEPDHMWPPHAETATGQVYYLLGFGGDPGNVRDLINGITILRAARFDVTLFARCAGPVESTAVQFQAVSRALATAWEEVRAVVEDPNNLNRTDTKWWTTKDLRCGPVTRRADRAQVVGSFVALYDRTVEPM